MTSPCGAECYILIFLLAWLSAYLASRGRRASLESKGVVLGPLYLIINIRSLAPALEERLRGNRWASRLLSASPAVAAALMGYALYFLARNLFLYFAAPSGFAAVVPLVPFLTLRSAQLIGIFLAAVPLLLVPHELSHALAAAARGIKIKGVGFLLVAFLLGAFVELDEDLFRSAGWRRRAVTAAAGPTANAAIAGLLFLLLVTQPTSYLYLPGPIASQFYSPSPGVLVVGVMPGSPAQAAGLSPGDVILSINGIPIQNLSSLANLSLSAGEPLSVEVERGGQIRVYHLVAAEISGRAMMGVYLSNYMAPRFRLPYFGPTADYFLLWLLTISFAVAAFNMLPMAPFDGAVFADALLSPLVGDERTRRAILHALYALSAALLVGNVALSFVRFGVPNL